jgi:hypothetical protein
MWEDPIVEEVHAIREQLLARFGGDLHKYCEYVESLSTGADEARKPAMHGTASPHPSAAMKTD